MNKMSIGELLIRFCVGGTLVVAVTLVSKYGSSLLAGVLMMFPAVTLVSLDFISVNNNHGVQQAAIGGLIGLVTTVAFLVSVALFAKKTNVFLCLAIGVAVWFVIAFIIVLIINRQ